MKATSSDLDNRVLASAKRCGINPTDESVVGRLRELIAISVAGGPPVKRTSFGEREKILLHCRQAGMTYREIGERFNVTRERARQLVLRAQRLAGPSK